MAYGNKCRGLSWASYGAPYSTRGDSQEFYHRIPRHRKPYVGLSNAIGWASFGVGMVVSIWVYGSAHRGVRLPLRSLKYQFSTHFTSAHHWHSRQCDTPRNNGLNWSEVAEY